MVILSYLPSNSTLKTSGLKNKILLREMANSRVSLTGNNQFLLQVIHLVARFKLLIHQS